ncbi:MAG: CHAT domain-containing protein [Bacteroidota bacterium]
MSKPLIVAAFADFRQGDAFLPALKKEVEAVENALKKAKSDGICSYEIIRDATREKVEAVFQDAALLNRIAVFHYAGHATANKLFFENADGTSESADAFGLLPLLATADALQLVFFNGCLTSKMAVALNDRGVPAVIGTVSRVKDTLSMELAQAFYQRLANGLPLDKIWQQSTAAIQAMIGEDDYRDYYKEESVRGDVPLGVKEDRLPWEIYYREGAEDVKYWNLPSAAGQPLFGLPDIQKQYDLPNVPYRLMSAYTQDDARIFFGRGTYIQDLFQRLNGASSSPVVLFFGASGAGKSSFLDAGLYPRLKKVAQIRYERRSPQNGLLWNVRQVLGLVAEAPVGKYSEEAQRWKAAWLEMEEKGQQKFILILDQVEEVFTRRIHASYNEMDYVIRCIGELFNDPTSRPAGKLLLAYRKEFHAEIRSYFHRYNIPKEEVFLKNLDRQGIEEVVNGLRSTEAHRLKYQLDMDEQLSTHIAMDLGKEDNSPVAPMLQILLSRLWQSQDLKAQKYFSLEDYQQLKSEGLHLEDFFQRQMAAIRQWASSMQEQVEASGLVLDVLHFHTTDIGTAASHSLQKLEEVYVHQEKVLMPLVTKLASLQLLYKREDGQMALAHDTLAPIIQKHFRASDRTGQRARRILETKVKEYSYAPSEVFIDEVDLAVVQQGAAGMRHWNDTEKVLIEKSIEKNDKDKRRNAVNRRLLLYLFGSALILMTSFALLLGKFLQQNRKDASINRSIGQALLAEKSDPIEAMVQIEKALAIDPKHPVAIQARHDIYSNNHFYKAVIQHPSAAVAVDISVDNLLASAAGQYVFLWQKDFEQSVTIDLDGEVTTLRFSPDGQQLLIGTKDNSAVICKTDGQRIRRLLHEDWVTAVAFAPDGKSFVTGDRIGQIHLWSADKEVPQRFQAHFGPVSSLAISSTGDTLFSGGWDGVLKLWDKSGKPLEGDWKQEDRILSIQPSSDGQQLLTACRNGEGNIWDLPTGNHTKLLGHRQRVNKALWVQDQYVLTASDDYQLKLWSTRGQVLRDYKGHRSYVHDVALSPDHRWMASVSADSSLRIWQLESKVSHFMEGYSGEISALALTSKEELLAASRTSLSPSSDLDFFDAFETTSSQKIYRWNANGQLLDAYEGHEDNINGLAISPDQKYWLSGGADARAILWDTSGQIIRQFETTSPIQSVAFSPSGRQLLFAQEDSTASLWSIEGDSLATFSGHKDLVSQAIFTPDSQFVLTASYDDTIRLFKLDQQLLQKYAGHNNRVSAIGFHPNGQQMLSTGWDNRAILWTLDGQQLQSFYLDRKNKTGGQAIHCFAFSPDGKLLALGAEDGLIKVFTISGQEIQTMQSPQRKGVYSLVFSEDGKSIMSGGGAKEIRSWHILPTQ